VKSNKNRENESGQINRGEVLVACSRYKMRNADNILIGKPEECTGQKLQEITVEIYVRKILKRG
jgi:hypothetical protein